MEQSKSLVKLENSSSQRQLATNIASTVSEAEGAALHAWASQLLIIKHSQEPAVVKAKRAIDLSRQSQIILPVLKMLGREVKRRAWDERGAAGRLGLGGAAVGLALFGGQGAGIAAFGTAIGVPLWVVLGSGSAFAGVLMDELVTKKKANPTTIYTVVDAKRVDE